MQFRAFEHADALRQSADLVDLLKTSAEEVTALSTNARVRISATARLLHCAALSATPNTLPPRRIIDRCADHELS